jgi:hypothetical protein
MLAEFCTRNTEIIDRDYLVHVYSEVVHQESLPRLSEESRRENSSKYAGKLGVHRIMVYFVND